MRAALSRFARLAALYAADWFDLVAADHFHTIAGRLRGWASR